MHIKLKQGYMIFSWLFLVLGKIFLRRLSVSLWVENSCSSSKESWKEGDWTRATHHTLDRDPATLSESGRVPGR